MNDDGMLFDGLEYVTLRDIDLALTQMWNKQSISSENWSFVFSHHIAFKDRIDIHRRTQMADAKWCYLYGYRRDRPHRLRNDYKRWSGYRWSKWNGDRKTKL